MCSGVPVRLLAEEIVFQEAFKKRSNLDAVSASIFGRLGSVWEGQDSFKILIDFGSENGAPRPSKIKKNQWFYNIRELVAI